MSEMVILGFSGGVDSACAAALLCREGWDVRALYLENGSGEAESARRCAEAMGLPLEVISWGSMLSLAQQALLTKSWWAVVIPGIFLVATLLSVTLLGNALRYRNSHNRGKI